MALTLSDEVSLVWRRPKTMSSVLFFANRYLLAFFNCAVVLSLVVPVDAVVCVKLQRSHDVILLVSQLVVVLIFVLRTYALCGCRRNVLVSLGTLILVFVIAHVIWIFIYGGFRPHMNNYDDNFVEDMYMNGLVCLEDSESDSWLLWLGAFAVDICVLVMTIRKTCGVSRDLRAIPKRMPLATLMLRDGSIYFMIMAILHLSNIVVYWLSMVDPSYHVERVTWMTGGGSTSGPLSEMSNCLAVTLTSRLMLNLHEHAHAGVLSTGAEADASLVSGIIFRDLVPAQHPQSNEYALAEFHGPEIDPQAENDAYIPPMEFALEPLLTNADLQRVSDV
ncbi:hypothetical protein PLICRDRAFT_46402 [Plicaturopsis crispa FD-325 SS-3]|uniref:DUF6533 domain-containing protein n=1 Tax=Plicaturopsis crispa FD-325 SS-3 TaxID=944288 RepID=A0A0C9SKP0_PLICR|nr:hypothetical protein PLICRDRAFT_46402 [Plicaturopsis crispa FD-325 SS-3]